MYIQVLFMHVTLFLKFREKKTIIMYEFLIWIRTCIFVCLLNDICRALVNMLRRLFKLPPIYRLSVH